MGTVHGVTESDTSEQLTLTLDNPGHSQVKILNLTTSANILFPSKVTLTSPWVQDVNVLLGEGSSRFNP